jgi:xanthine/CO dehydrogenase XdhC/CoxF family maturation factor
VAIVGERVPLDTNELAGMAALLQRWQRERVRAVVARVVDLDRPGLPPTGTALAVSERGEVRGSLGRCDTEAVAAAALEVMRQGRPRLVSFSVGLCGDATVHVFLEPVDWPGLGR